MQIKNNYDLGVFNGDIGWIRMLDKEEREAVIRIDGKDYLYGFEDMVELTHAWCCTIHKSQGGEFEAVVDVTMRAHWIMLQRNLLYTSVTRAKKLCVIVGQKEAVAQAIRNDKIKYRNSGLEWRLKTQMEVGRVRETE